MKLIDAISETGKARLPNSGNEYVSNFYDKYYWFPCIAEMIPVKKKDLKRTDWESKKEE